MKNRRQAYLFFAVSILFHLAASFAHPVTPTIIKDRGFGDYVFGAALAAMMATNFLFSPFWGRLVSYISSRRIILIGSLGYATGQAMFGLAGSEAALIGARVFAGVFTGGVFTAYLTYIVNTSPDDLRGSFLAIGATIGAVASAFGFFIGGMLGEIGVHVAMTAQVIVLFSSGIAFYFVCEDDATMDLREIRPRTLWREANPLAAMVSGRNFMTPMMATLFAVCALANLGGTAFDQSFNYYMKAQLGLSSGYNGAIKGVVGLVTLAANSTIGLYLINKTDVRKSLIWVYLLCSGAIAGVILLNGMAPVIASNVFYFAVFAVSVPLTQSIVAKNAKGGSDSNLVLGYYNGLRSLGGIVGALSAGFLYTVNPKWPFVLGLFAYGLATLGSVTYERLSRNEVVAHIAG